MDDPVAPFFGAPIVIRTGLISRFTVIAVDPQVKTTDGKTVDVIFIGTGFIVVLLMLNSRKTRLSYNISNLYCREIAQTLILP